MKKVNSCSDGLNLKNNNSFFEIPSPSQPYKYNFKMINTLINFSQGPTFHSLDS